MLTISELAAQRFAAPALDESGLPEQPLVVVDLDSDPRDVAGAAEAAARLAGRAAVLAGVARSPLAGQVDRLVEQLDLSLTVGEQDDRRAVTIDGDVDAALGELQEAARACPRAAVSLCGVLRVTVALPPELGLLAESFAYSTLLAGPEHARWLATRPRRRHAPPADGPSVRVERSGDRVSIVLDRPEHRNAYGRRMRDELVAALGLLDADDTITEVELRGEGPAFSSGGDLDEFGCAPDPATAHLVRSAASAGALLQRHRARIRARVHGACVGAGVELPAFAAHVTASSDAWFQLPEVAMGLLPGAGGTVSVSRRVGRWRTAYLALTGVRLPARAARTWGLVDELADP